jgi:Listeria/Bacterioides repeat
MKKRILSYILTLALVLTLLPTVALAAETVIADGATMTISSGSPQTITSGNTLTVKSGGTLNIASGGALTVASGATFTIEDGGTLVNNGEITGNFTGGGTISGSGTINGVPMVAGENVNVPYYDPATGGMKTQAYVTEINDSSTALTSGWYYVPATTNISTRIEVTGDVNLILGDGATLTTNQGIQVAESTPNNSLTIRAQSTGASMGTLNATGLGGDAAIGGNAGVSSDGETAGTININGGLVTANSLGDGAGIGGGGGLNGGAGGIVNIGGGVVAASSSTGDAGIGGGTSGDGANSTGTISGNAVIYASPTFAHNGTHTNAIVFQGGTGTVYGDVTLQDDLTINASQTLSIPGGKSLTIPAGKTLTNGGSMKIDGELIVNGTFINNGTLTNNHAITNNGEITNSNGATFTNDGSILGGGTFTNDGIVSGSSIYTVTYDANDGSSRSRPVTLPDNVPHDIIDTPFTRSGYTFSAWNAAADGSGASYAVGATYTANANLTLYAQWRQNSSGNTGGNVTTPAQLTTKIGGVDVNYSINTSGVVTLKPTAAQLDNLLKTIDDDGVLNNAVSGIANMKSAIIEIDLTKLIANNKLQVFVFNVLSHEIRLPVGALESMQKLAKTLRFGVAPGSIVFDLTDASGKAINWYDYQNPVTVSMPFAAPQDISTHQIVMVDKADDTIIPRSWYADGSVYAKVSAPGTYDAAIKPLAAFTDTNGKWMAEAVGYMGARGIVEGVGNNLFDAQGTITRAHFVTMLMRALDLELDYEELMPPEDFADAPEWAQKSIRMATALGLTLRDEDGSFNPNAPILRQDMFFMAYEAMEACGMLPSAYTQNIVPFTDWDDVRAEYADAIQNLCKLKLVNGNGDGTVTPNGESTRSEGAQFLYNVLKYDAK